VRDVFSRLNYSISTHYQENVVFWVKGPAIMHIFEILDPKVEPIKCITSKKIWLQVELIVIA